MDRIVFLDAGIDGSSDPSLDAEVWRQPRLISNILRGAADPPSQFAIQ
jgi:hypothetical protein